MHRTADTMMRHFAIINTWKDHFHWQNSDMLIALLADYYLENRSKISATNVVVVAQEDSPEAGQMKWIETGDELFTSVECRHQRRLQMHAVTERIALQHLHN